MSRGEDNIKRIAFEAETGCDIAEAERLAAAFPLLPSGEEEAVLRLGADGLRLCLGARELRGDLLRMALRLRARELAGETLVRAAKVKGAQGELYAIDATAGLGEDSLLLAAAGFRVDLYERNPVIYELLRDALRRAEGEGIIGEAVSRMTLHFGDSAVAMRNVKEPPHVILLDPMFPERKKSGLVKNKLQMIQKLESPCDDEESLFAAAVSAAPFKLIIKRSAKCPLFAGIKPDYSIGGKAVRYDCFVSPAARFGAKK